MDFSAQFTNNKILYTLYCKLQAITSTGLLFLTKSIVNFLILSLTIVSQNQTTNKASVNQLSTHITDK